MTSQRGWFGPTKDRPNILECLLTQMVAGRKKSKRSRMLWWYHRRRVPLPRNAGYSEGTVAIVKMQHFGATEHIERHVSSFSGNPPVSIKSLKRSWMPQGKTKKRMARGEMDMPAIHMQLEQHGFIEKQSTPWASLDASEVADLLQGKFEVFEEFE